MKRERFCLYILSTWFDFLHSFAPSPFTLKLKYISTPVLWPNCSPMSLFPLWHSIFCIFPNLNYFFISYLTFSTLFSNLPGEDFFHPTYSIRTPAQIFYCSPVCDICQGANFTCKVLCMLLEAEPCVIELWHYRKQQTATFIKWYLLTWTCSYFSHERTQPHVHTFIHQAE